MPRTYQRKQLADGSPNPKYRKRPARRADGSPRSRGTRKAARPSKWANAPFLAWDGEGLGDGPAHRYVLLCASDGTELADLAGLRTRTLLTALVDGLVRRPDAIHVGFAFSYDTNMLFRQLPDYVLRRVQAGEWSYWRDFRFRWRRTKQLLLQQLRPRDAGGDFIWVGGIIWDVFGFFQASFVKALRAYDVASADVLDRILGMKDQRATFTPDSFAEIVAYCREECQLLVGLMDKLRDHLGTAGLQIRRWDGAGACASALLRREQVPAHMGPRPAPRESDPWPAGVREASQYAFAGGRIEAVMYGHAPRTTIYHGDLRSAYPAAMTTCPCLAHGMWLPDDTGAFRVEHIRWHFDADQNLYPFFWREPDGRVLFPPTGEGWYWAPEVNAARDALARGLLSGRLDRLGAWSWQTACTCTPFQFIPRLYAQRAVWKAEGIGAEKALKLALNSLYGKCAQRLGGTVDKAPPLHQLEWAGWITSQTRAQLYATALPAAVRDQLVCLATDGIFALEPLPVVAADTLGGWELHTHRGMTLVQSGVYWVDDPGAEGARARSYYRGFDPGSLDRRAVVTSWRKRLPDVPVTSTRFQTLGKALTGPNQRRLWCQWITHERRLDLWPTATKRMARGERPSPHRGMVPTWPRDPRAAHYASPLSTPVELPWMGLPGVDPLADLDLDEEAIA